MPNLCDHATFAVQHPSALFLVRKAACDPVPRRILSQSPRIYSARKVHQLFFALLERMISSKTPIFLRHKVYRCRYQNRALAYQRVTDFRRVLQFGVYMARDAPSAQLSILKLFLHVRLLQSTKNRLFATPLEGFDSSLPYCCYVTARFSCICISCTSATLLQSLLAAPQTVKCSV